ncbi:CHAT domain-containing protein [Marmoricola sp. RAF53]|uniref:CHAT domain-containing protein n=1 Tax=Marmoricola sp. RAF53 TaxID=3233059 RepID=UPI003F9E6E54
MDDAESLHLRAIEAANNNEFARSVELTEQARALTDDPDLLDRLDVTASRGVAETGDPDKAIALCERVLTRDGVVPLTAGLAHSQLGMLYMMHADSTAAFEHFALGIDVLADHPLHLGRVLINRGLVHLQRGDPASAAADFSGAAESFERAGEPVERAKAVFNLGYTHLLRNDFVAAMRGMDEAAETLVELSPVNRAIAQQDRAEVLVASGRTREAIEALEAASAAYGSQRLRRLQAECEYILARTLLAEEPARARTVARAAARRFRAHGSDPWALRADSIALVAEIESGASAKALIPVCDDVVAGLRKAGHTLDADRLALHAARLVVRRGDFADAAARVNRVRTTQDSPITTQLLTREVRAELAEAQGQSARMRSHARRGLAELHTWQATFGSLDLQSSTVGHGQHLARLGLRAAMADGSPEVVFEWSERARALASRVTSLRPPPDPALAADLTELRVADPQDRARVRELKERIRSHTWFAAEGTVGEPIGLATLQQRLATDDAALVAHVVLDEEVTALAVTARDAAVVPIGPLAPIRALLDRVSADLDFAAQNRTGDIAAAVRGSLRTDLSALAEHLVRPLLGTVGYRRLVLTPSAALAGTPWNCLPGLIGRPLTIPASATRWIEQTATPVRPPAIAGFVAGPRLQRAEEEVRRAATAWPTAQVLTGADADAARAGWLASRVDLFHVAGHGLHPGDHPLFAAVELADGPWFGHDVDLLPRTPDVVLLSACDLGRVSVLHGEESVGMSAAWLHAGARTVISSPALLADDVACEVFAAWHLLVAAGTPPADALAQVCAETEDVVPLLSFGAGW